MLLCSFILLLLTFQLLDYLHMFPDLGNIRLNRTADFQIFANLPKLGIDSIDFG